MLPHLWLWGNFASIKNFGGLSAPPVICPYRAEQATGLAGGYDYAFRQVEHEVRNRQPPAVRVGNKGYTLALGSGCNISLLLREKGDHRRWWMRSYFGFGTPHPSAFGCHLPPLGKAYCCLHSRLWRGILLKAFAKAKASGLSCWPVVLGF